MSTLTVAQFREHFETDLGNDAIQRVIDSVESEIADAVGPVGSVTKLFYPSPRTRSLYIIDGPITGITSLTETVGDVDTLLDPEDYLLTDGFRITRKYYGDSVVNPAFYWGSAIEAIVTYPAAPPRRIMVTIDIVKSELQYNGLIADTAGGYNRQKGDWITEKARLIASIRNGLPLV